MSRMSLIAAMAMMAMTASFQPARAQTLPPMTEEQKAEFFQEAFDAGLKAINEKNFELGIRAFRACVQIYPERPTAYYNLACIFSLQGKLDDSLKFLKDAMDRGFTSFEHMTRDTDLENLRKDKRFEALVSEYRAKFEKAVQGEFIAPEGSGPWPLLVFLHGRGGNPKQMAAALEPIAKAQGFALLLPQGDVADGAGFSWGSGGETVVREMLAKTLAEKPIDKSRVVLGGFSIGALEALDIALNSETKFNGFFALAPYYDGTQLEAKIPGLASRLPVFLVSGLQDPVHDRAVEARNAFAKAGGRVVLRRFEGGHQLPEKLDELTSEAMAFLLQGKAPASAGPRQF